VLREAPFSAILMATYEFMKVFTLRNGGQEKDMSYLENAMNGAVAGSVASLTTNPIDVVKTRMMVSREVHGSTMYRTTLDIMSDEGIQGFFKASHIRLLSVSIACILFFTIYEPAKAWVAENRSRTSEGGLH
jgi:hypothetical protein